MIIRNSIYGNEVKHDKTYWRDSSTTGTIIPVVEKDPYLLEIRHNNPVPGFVISLLVFVSICTLTYSIYTNSSGLGLKDIAILMPIIYAMIIVIVSLIRLCRRISAFHVKKNRNFEKGNKLHVQ